MAWNFRRWLRHELTGASAVRKVLSAEALARLGGVVAQSEKRHTGEIRLAVEASLDLPLFRNGISARERALAVFSDLHVWDTEANNGVLIYLLLADHDVEIVADRGIHEIVGAVGWEEICHAMERAFRLGRFEEGLEEGIRAVSQHLEAHFPATGADDRNELPDEPVLLR
ncbi:MAG: hypothetical protein K0Q91_992 [Fibrobacteria bacterium]|nr:hypothetical protein [Fibrobacteria bacterium]